MEISCNKSTCIRYGLEYFKQKYLKYVYHEISGKIYTILFFAIIIRIGFNTIYYVIDKDRNMMSVLIHILNYLFQ